MVHYLSDKLDAAESYRKIGLEICEDEVKELIFAGLPAEQYAIYIREIQGDSLKVICSKLVKYDKEIISPREEVFEARRRRGSDRKMHRGDGNSIVIVACLLTLLFRVGTNPSDDLFEPLHNHTDCICEGSGPRKVCTCTPFLFLMFESCVVAAFTILLLMGFRLTKDFRLCGWIWTLLGFVAIAFLLSIYIVTPWMFRWTMMIIELVAVLSVCLLMLIVRYWRSIWFF